MIEVGIFDGGSHELPFTQVPSGQRVSSATLEEQRAESLALIQAQVRRAVLADRLGFDYYWMSEHHFGVEGPELSTNPIQLQTAIAALTKRIRLGQMANNISFHHPLRLAEQAAILDIISDGRVELGIGRGYQGREAEVFGQIFGSTTQDQERNRSQFEESFEILLKAWTENSFSYHGEFFTIPPSYTLWNHPQTIAYFAEGLAGVDVHDVFEDPEGSAGPPVTAGSAKLRQITVSPRPMQQPHPPLWQPLNSPRSMRWAASKGLNGAFLFETNEALRPKIDIYLEAAEQNGWPDLFGGGEFKPGWDSERHRGVAAGRVVHIEDPSLKHADLAKHSESQMFQWDFFKGFGFASLLANPGETPDMHAEVSPELLREKGVIASGSKEQVIDSLLTTKETCYPDSDFITNLWFESAGIGYEAIEEQMQFFAEEIMPVLRNECGGGPDLSSSEAKLLPDYNQGVTP